MREIKFRYWYENKLYPALTLQELVHNGEFEGTDIDDCILMQFTGLVDRLGKEIWEGDIVKHDDFSDGVYFSGQPQRNSVVEWSSMNACFHLKEYTAYGMDRKLEVIGNIWENPALLKDGAK